MEADTGGRGGLKSFEIEIFLRLYQLARTAKQNNTNEVT